MNTTRQNTVEAVQDALNQSDPFLAASFRTFVAKGTFTPPPVGRGQTIYATFTPSAPMPQDEANAILETLKRFKDTPTGERGISTE